MTHTTRTRRWLLTTVGSATIAGLAGCSSEGEPETDGETETDDSADGRSEDGTHAESDDGVEKDGDDEQDEAVVDDSEWKGIDEFRFEGRTEAWTGIEPALIEGEDNPTILLFEGEEYDFSWVNEDGAIHNLEIWDDDGDVIDDYETDSADTEGEEVALANVVASQEMSSYVCMYHRGTQIGEIEVRSL